MSDCNGTEVSNSTITNNSNDGVLPDEKNESESSKTGENNDSVATESTEPITASESSQPKQSLESAELAVLPESSEGKSSEINLKTVTSSEHMIEPAKASSDNVGTSLSDSLKSETDEKIQSESPHSKKPVMETSVSPQLKTQDHKDELMDCSEDKPISQCESSALPKTTVSEDSKSSAEPKIDSKELEEPLTQNSSKPPSEKIKTVEESNNTESDQGLKSDLVETNELTNANLIVKSDLLESSGKPASEPEKPAESKVSLVDSSKPDLITDTLSKAGLEELSAPEKPSPPTQTMSAPECINPSESTKNKMQVPEEPTHIESSSNPVSVADSMTKTNKSIESEKNDSTSKEIIDVEMSDLTSIELPQKSKVEDKLQESLAEPKKLLEEKLIDNNSQITDSSVKKSETITESVTKKSELTGTQKTSETNTVEDSLSGEDKSLIVKNKPVTVDESSTKESSTSKESSTKNEKASKEVSIAKDPRSETVTDPILMEKEIKVEEDESQTDKQSLEVEVDSVSETLSEKIADLNSIPKIESEESNSAVKVEDAELNTTKKDSTENSLLIQKKESSSVKPSKKALSLVEAYSDTSSSGSEVQCSAAPLPSSQENITASSEINFEKAIKAQNISSQSTAEKTDLKMEVDSEKPSVESMELDQPKKEPATSDVPVITIDDNTQSSAPEVEIISVSSQDAPASSGAEDISTVPVKETPAASTEIQVSGTTEIQGSGTSEAIPTPPVDQQSTTEPKTEVKTETAEQPLQPPAIPIPIVAPTPRKRGRPRKQVLPIPNASGNPEFQMVPPSLTPKGEGGRASRAEKRQSRKRKFDDDTNEMGEKKVKRRRRRKKDLEDGVGDKMKEEDENNPQGTPKKKRKSTYIPRRKMPPPKRRRTEMENVQNFEEETRMSASELAICVSIPRSGTMGDESQSSSVTDTPNKSNINKKGRMEVVSDSKPVTAQQIVEYYWPPHSSLAPGEKSEGLMIQEQITEYLGVKSFKRKYPTVKRRPVDMEERNYLQENGFVSENMCDMGLTAVCSAEILEIMYNDFPHKFEEYRRYSREKKAKEQRALREKQAAERADMDPMKEAVESAHSWNSDFNKTRRFRIVHRNPSQRQFSDGNPIPAFERVVFLHGPNNSALCVEDEYWKMTLFAYECEISSHTKLDKTKQYLNQNIWSLIVGRL